MEPERPVEKLLRGYVRQRRAQLGEPPPMHPAARRQLLSEVARAHDRRQGGGGWWLILKGFWPRLALGAAGMAVLMVGAAIWTSPGGKNAEVQLAKSEGLRSTSTGIALEKKAVTDAPSLAQDLSGAATNSIILAQASEADALSVPSPAIPVRSLAVKQELQPGAAQSKGKDTAVSTFAENTPSRARQESSRDKETRYDRTAGASGVEQLEQGTDSARFGIAVKADTRAESTGELAQAAEAPTQNQAMSFQNTSVTQIFRNQMPTGSQAAPATVMAQFRVEQDGAIVRIIDDDGSIYTGSLREAELPTAAKSAPTVALSSRRSGPAQPASQISPNDTQNFRLEVTGTNRTLNQKVVFSGNLVGNQISLSNNAQNQQVARQNQKLQQQLSNVMRISGNARVGSATDQAVEAVPLQ